MDADLLRKLQLTELQTLRDVHTLCTEHGLTCFLIGGTLLGAVRHGGFIPWDDDLDIALPRPDYERLLALCEQGALGNDYYLHHYRTDPGYWLPFAKIRKNHTLFDEPYIQKLDCHKGIYIDVFPLDCAKRARGPWYHLKPFILRTFMVLIGLRRFGYQRVHIAYRALYLLTRPLSIRTLSAARDRLARACKRGKYLVGYASNYRYTRQTFPAADYFPASAVSFEGAEFPAPRDPRQVLKTIYGPDYMRLPPPEERLDHHAVRVVFDTRADHSDGG